MKNEVFVPLDIHTHQLPQLPGRAIVNGYPSEEFVPQAGGWYSVGVHPWHVSSPIGEEEMWRLSALVRHPQVLAVGEAGLDKLATAPMEVQAEVFRRQARLAEEMGKPLVIHLVKATDELLRVKREVRPSQPWIIHGFRGKAAMADELLRHGFYLSFGERYQPDALLRVPQERLFVETDESAVPLEELYARAARVRGVSVEELEETVRSNVRSVFFKP